VSCGRRGHNGATHGAPLDEFCNTVFSALSVPDMMEIGFGVTAGEAFNEPKRSLSGAVRAVLLPLPGG
jgi:hypothetical protein